MIVSGRSSCSIDMMLYMLPVSKGEQIQVWPIKNVDLDEDSHTFNSYSHSNLLPQMQIFTSLVPSMYLLRLNCHAWTQRLDKQYHRTAMVQPLTLLI